MDPQRDIIVESLRLVDRLAQVGVETNVSFADMHYEMAGGQMMALRDCAVQRLEHRFGACVIQFAYKKRVTPVDKHEGLCAVGVVHAMFDAFLCEILPQFGTVGLCAIHPVPTNIPTETLRHKLHAEAHASGYSHLLSFPAGERELTAIAHACHEYDGYEEWIVGIPADDSLDSIQNVIDEGVRIEDPAWPFWQRALARGKFFVTEMFGKGFSEDPFLSAGFMSRMKAYALMDGDTQMLELVLTKETRSCWLEVIDSLQRALEQCE